ncbi:hypothetical protein ACPXCE_07900 [Streptomyces sp. DT24]|uniref:hypothetical protein n=1 Tax=Streptomyces sp. DT24 TaxID=3416520 RepID=UPI003CF25754
MHADNASVNGTSGGEPRERGGMTEGDVSERPERAERSVWEMAVLDGGPAHGTRMRVADRPGVLQVTYPCAVVESPDGSPGESSGEGVRVQALFVYRRDVRGRAGQDRPVRYGFDAASP